MGLGMGMGIWHGCGDGYGYGYGGSSRVPHIHVCHKFYGMLHVACCMMLEFEFEAFPGTFFEDVVQSKVVAS